MDSQSKTDWKWLFKMAWRDSRRSKSRLFLFISSIIIGIAALVAINSFSDNLKDDINSQAKELLGADLELGSNDSTFNYGLVDTLAHEVSYENSFASMVFFPKNQESRLVDVRALEGDFPYYGKIETEPANAEATFRDGERKALVDQSVMIQFDVAQEYKAINDPWQYTKKIFLPFVASATIAPIIDGYYHIFSPDDIPNSTKWGHTFSTIPLAIFFVVGIIYLIFKIKRKNLLYSEFLMLFWYASIYVILTGSIESYNTSRHFIPLIFPMILIMSYALWRFLSPLQNKIKIPFFIVTCFSHAVTFLIFWKKIYFEPSIVWNLPASFEFNQVCSLSDECIRQAVNLKEALANPIVLFSGIAFIILFLILYINKNKINYKETKKDVK